MVQRGVGCDSIDVHESVEVRCRLRPVRYRRVGDADECACGGGKCGQCGTDHFTLLGMFVGFGDAGCPSSKSWEMPHIGLLQMRGNLTSVSS